MNAMPPKLPKRVRIREKYNREPNAREKAYHIWLMETYPCVCGCGKQSTIVHHPLQEHPDQRWRRDHEYVVPMNGYCHFDLHQKRGTDEYAEEADALRSAGIAMGKL